MSRPRPGLPTARAWAIALATLDTGAAGAAPTVVLELVRADHRALERLADGSEFNRDEGPLTERRLGLRWPGGQGWRGQLELARTEAALTYTGRSSFGLPLLSQTAWRHEQADLLAVRDAALTPALHGWAGLGLGRSTAVRAIAATDVSLPLTERLQRREALVDLGLRWQPAAARWALLAEGRLRQPLSQRLQAESPGGLDAVQLRPDAGSAWRLRLGLQAALPLAPGLRWGLHLHRERVRVGASGEVPARRQGLPVGTASFPGSVARQRGTALSLTADF